MMRCWKEKKTPKKENPTPRPKGPNFSYLESNLKEVDFLEELNFA